MKSPRLPALALLVAALAPVGATAQDAPPGPLEEVGRQFEASAGKFVALAEAMPEATYDWRPGEGVASVVEVFMHVAQYNYYYPDVALSVEPPPGLDYEKLEGVVTAKEQAVEILTRSMDHVRAVLAGMSPDDVARPTRLYGRDVGQWAVLLQLVTHMNEHLGQSIAYARTNGVVPPWSR
jgi:uncharacterized damage-inducible protein DinB